MKMLTKNLQAGQVMQSGDIVVSAQRDTKNGNPQMRIVLENPITKFRRIALWNLYGNVFVKGS